MTQSLPFKGLHVLGIGYGLTTLATRSGSADLLLGSDLAGLALDFTSSLWFASTGKYGDARIRSAASPGMVFYGPPVNKLTYAAPSNKWTRRANGLIAEWTAGADLPFTWDASGNLLGLMVEPQSTNLATRSNDFANSVWDKTSGPVTISANSDTSPDGSTNAHRIVEANATSNHGIYRACTVVNGTRYTSSFWLKAGTRSWVRIIEGAGTTAAASFNLATGALGAVTGTGSPSSRIEAFPNGWYRCAMSFTAIGTGALCQLRLATGDGVGSYAGDGTGYVIAYGAQLEPGSAPSSYIPTVAATVTRAADDISLLTSAFPYGASANSALVTYQQRFIDISTTQALAVFHDTTQDEEALFYAFGSADGFQIRDGAVAQGNLNPSGTTAANTTYRLASAWAANDFAVTRNGGTAVTDTSGTVPAPTRLQIGARAGPVIAHPVIIQRIAHVPRRRPNAELQGWGA